MSLIIPLIIKPELSTFLLTWKCTCHRLCYIPRVAVLLRTLNNLIEIYALLFYYNIPKIVPCALKARIDKYTPIWKIRPHLNYYLRRQHIRLLRWMIIFHMSLLIINKGPVLKSGFSFVTWKSITPYIDYSWNQALLVGT